MFLPDRQALKVFLYRKPVDMRKQRNGLAAHERKRHGGKLIPADFPGEEVIHDPAEHEKVCPNDGATLKPMGAETALRYHFQRPQLRVREHKRLKYSCSKC